VRGYAHVIREDLVNRDLLFLGTEFGLWISLDGGAQWAQYKGGDLPNVAVRDLAIHPRDNDLVIATHGRGIWIIDDITPLRALTRTRWRRTPSSSRPSPGAAHLGRRRLGQRRRGVRRTEPAGDAVITYYQKKRHIFGDLKIEVFGPDGKSSAHPEQQAPRPQSRELVDALKPPRCRPPRARLRRRLRPARAARHLHGEDDEGQAGLRRRSSPRPRPALDAHGRRPQGAVRPR
jgi:hypothetical protein